MNTQGTGVLSSVRARKNLQSIFVIVGIVTLLVALLTLLGLIVNLFVQGGQRLNLDFLFSFPSRFAERAGIYSAWVGSISVVSVTALLGIPVGVLAGIYLEEYASKNKVTTFIEINILNLAGVPSIVYGLMALGLFVYALGLGQTILTAGLTLALLILPVVITATRESIRAVPSTIREAAYALGATKWQTIQHHVLPSSLGGILTGTMIALSRAIGETAPLVTIGALSYIAFLPEPPLTATPPFISADFLSSPFTVLPIQVFNWISRPQEAFHANAAAAGLVLIALTFSMNALAIYIRYRVRKRVQW